MQVARSASQLVRVLAPALLFLEVSTATAAKKSVKADTEDEPPACSMATGKAGNADDSDDDAKGVRRLIGGTCVNLSGYTQATGQAADVSQPRAVLGPTPLQMLTLNGDARFETARATGYGAFKTAFEIDWSYYSDTGFDRLPNLDEASISFVGVTAGFAESLMNFWSGDFQFKTAGPNLSSYLVNKEFDVSETTRLAFGIEAGPPSSRGAEAWKFPSTPPYYTSRLKYEKDDWTIHASGAAQETETSKTPLLSGTEQKQLGWAASLGAEIPLKLLGDEDTASFQMTYAVNSRVFLGSSTDRAALASLIPRAVAVPTTGWSAIGSFAHEWNENWASNFFASHVAVDFDAAFASPSIRSSRVGANLIYQLSDKWQVGVEASHVNARIDPNGTLGLINGGSFAGKTGFLWMKWEP